MNNQSQPKYESGSQKIKVLGLGGSGCNTITRLSALNLEGVELIAANTDFHSLSSCRADRVIRLGINTTNGQGAGGNLSTGRTAAEENYKDLIECIQNTDLLFLTTGLGGGTGSGAIEIAARIATSLDILTISIVTLPFSFEAEKRKSIAYEATISLQPFTNTLITIPNDRLVGLAAPNTPINTAFGMADDILIKGIQGITGILDNHGFMNIDFSHISKLMRNGGGAYISIGYGQGEERVVSAIQNALIHPLLEKTPIHQARGIIIKITGDLKINEIDSAVAYLKEIAGEDTEILPVVEQRGLINGQVMASVLLTGIGATPLLYQAEYQHKPTELTEKDYILANDDKNFVFSKSPKDYEDELEVPAFLRKGYNLGKQY
jgi:cell division protein FtsZ